MGVLDIIGRDGNSPELSLKVILPGNVVGSIGVTGIPPANDCVTGVGGAVKAPAPMEIAIVNAELKINASPGLHAFFMTQMVVSVPIK